MTVSSVFFSQTPETFTRSQQKGQIERVEQWLGIHLLHLAACSASCCIQSGCTSHHEGQPALRLSHSPCGQIRSRKRRNVPGQAYGACGCFARGLHAVHKDARQQLGTVGAAGGSQTHPELFIAGGPPGSRGHESTIYFRSASPLCLACAWRCVRLYLLQQKSNGVGT